MPELKFNTAEEIDAAYITLQATFRAGTTRPLSWRKRQLNQVILMLRENIEAIVQALATDLRKPRLEALGGEIGPMVRRAKQSAAQLDEWARDESPQVPEWQRAWSPTILKRPKGVILVVSPWNYPIYLSLQPIIGAIAAGCPAVLKPSEVSPNVSSLLADLFPKYLDPSAYRVINGGVPEITHVLKLKWDHITYTGNGTVARIISRAAAEHLTPVTLELGGKSPVVIDPETTNLKIAAKRVLWGKTLNAGQVCVAPDYVLIPRSAQDAFVEAIKEAAVELKLDGALASDSFASIVSDTHFKRLRSIMTRSSGKIVVGGDAIEEQRRITPTVYRDVKENDSLLEGEIFGPILPIVPVDNIRQAIEYINAHPHPLVLYAFTDDPEVKQALRDETRSGGLHFNDVHQHMSVDQLPFSGVGESGHGSQALKFTYDEYTYLRSSVTVPFTAEPLVSLRYPPYTEAATQALAVRSGAIEGPAAST
ncbi:aldehyde dehydrogenase [Multifurca ochricompacta]|uniref:Aldehyde dehydrogenase n=1 Tax=Multifurca ochricompacta TaxID=376703 RepID=A0AAD4QMI4_9AGAM|nr:aldehyde dehydrogenase [Multifurca ochricompacta]